MRTTIPGVALLAAALSLTSAAGCANAGMGYPVRTDISARMATTAEPIASCYKLRLAANRKLRGTIVLAITAEAKTGQFIDVKIRRDELGDPDLDDCVVAEVAKLKLEKPTSTSVQFDYPLTFAPTK